MQAKPRLSEDMVKECVDPRLGGLYPPKAVAKVRIFISLDAMRLSEQLEVCTV
jgi:hypothetical protein